MLNIVVEESRILASRERCPFLVHLEVAETGLSGTDSRLYASGAPGLGATVEEALSMSASEMTAAAHDKFEQSSAPYQIPPELLGPSPQSQGQCPAPISKDQTPITVETEEEIASRASQKEFVRGGWQSEEAAYYASHPEDVFASNPYDAVRQDEYEQLHEQMHVEPGMGPPPVDLSDHR